MSESKRRKARFFSQHPYCCFCGGNTAATTEDHVPARAIFDERKWPEGYSFPACASCNHITRQDEKVVAFLSRIRTEDEEKQTPIQLAEMRRCMDAMQRDYPDAYRSIRPSANEVRKFLRDYNIPRPPGMLLSDVPIISIGRPEFVQPIRNFGIKLFCALHYKHTNKIAPSHSAIAIRMLTNVQLEQNAIEEKLLKLFGGHPILIRARNELSDQFNYRFTVASDQPTSAYICKFRQSFVVLGIVTTSTLPSEFDEEPENGAFLGAPFSYPR